MKLGLMIVQLAHNVVSHLSQVLTEAVRVSQQVYVQFIHLLLALFIVCFEESGAFCRTCIFINVSIS